MDEKASLVRSPTHDRTYARQLSRWIRASFKADNEARVEAAGTDIEAALAMSDVQTAWTRAKAWYRQASGRSPKPAREDLRVVFVGAVCCCFAPLFLQQMHRVARQQAKEPQTSYCISL